MTAAVRGLAGLGNDELDLEEDLPDGRTVIEASAGTGKTYALSALAVRALAEGRVTTAELLMVTFTRAAAAELRERTRATLLIADEMLRTGGDPPASHPWMRVLHAEDESDERERARRVHAAVHTFDDATITTIHGYCQQALRQIGLRAGTRLGAGLAAQSAALVDEVCRDLLVSRLVEDAHALSWVVEGEPAGAGLVLKRLNESVSKLLGNPGAMVVPDPANAAPAATDSLDRLARWCALVEQVRAEVLQRREARQQMAFDDLVTHLLAAVTNPEHGPAVVDDLRARHRLALLDEFQDTDPVQWRIFERVFTDRMVIVGDPKQAIYRFRGADVHAYLAATQGASTYRLGTNRRSDSDLVTATNTLVRGVRLGHPHIVGTDVEPAPDAATRSLGEGPPLELRHLAAAPQLLTKTGQVSAPLSRHAILADLVRVVGAVLDEHPDIDPGDIAVLVPSHPSAEMVYDALNRAGIPAVRTRTGSVLATPALEQWQLLLAALERPSHAPTVRGAALGALLETEVARLDPLSDGAGPLVVALQQRCMDWADRLSRTPLLAWYDAVREESGLVPRLLARPGGERMLTDLDHVAELLAAELGGRGNSVPAVRRTLHALAATAVEETDPQMRRIDSDARAVQITTLHASKGLEYPVVLLPFSWQTPPNMAPFVFQADQGRVVDVASNQGWSGPPLRSGDPDASNEVRKHYNSAEGRGDQLRLLYVGLTRAQRRTVVWWTPASGATSSALGALLLDRDDEGVPCNSEPSVTENEKRKVTTFIPKVDVNDDVVRRKLGVLAANGNGTIGVTECPADGPSIVWRGRHDTGGGELTVADPSGRWLADRSWRRWSFTALAQTAGDDFAVPVTGGADEPPQADVDVGDALVRPSMPLANATGGAAFGTFVHSVMEEVDPAGADLESALAALVTRQSERDRLPVGEDDVVRGLAAAMRTPLGPIAAGRCLADIPRHDRLAELRFDLPLVKATGRFAATAIGDVLQATLPRNDVLRPYAADLANGRFDGTLAGYLQGSIDAVLRVPDGLFDQRYVVVDYKTNRLHDFDDVDPLAAYRPDRLVAAMTHSDYPLQALLYSVALHRYLRWRLPGYQPERHLGGIAYLFVRGMVGVATPQHGGMPYGVFAWRPPAATILGLDALFATGGRS